MNPNIIKENIKCNLGKQVRIKEYGLRNKTNTYVGYISKIYPQIFIVQTQDTVKSISYVELINGEVNIEYL